MTSKKLIESLSQTHQKVGEMSDTPKVVKRMTPPKVPSNQEKSSLDKAKPKGKSQMSIKDLIRNSASSKKISFMGGQLSIRKLTLGQVNEIREIAQSAKDEENEAAGLEVLKFVVRTGAEGGEELTDEDFASMPMDELSKLSNEIMKFSGMDPDGKKGK